MGTVDNIYLLLAVNNINIFLLNRVLFVSLYILLHKKHVFLTFYYVLISQVQEPASLFYF